MKKAIILSLILAFAVLVSAGQEKAKPTPAPAPRDFIKVLVENGSNKVLEIRTADLAKLPRKEARAKDHDGKDVSYSGVELREVLKLGGAKFGADLRGQAMAYCLIVRAADDYSAVFALPELDDTYNDKIVILADTQNGKLLDSKNGPWQIIVPDEKKHARWVRQVTELHIMRGDYRIPISID